MLVKRQPNAKMRGDDQVIAISSLKMGLRTCMDDIMVVMMLKTLRNARKGAE